MSEQTLGQAVSVVHGSWATPAARDTQGQRGAAANARKGNPLDTLPNQMAVYGQAAPASSNTLGSRQGLWQTPKATNADCPVIHNPQRSDGGQPNLAAQMMLEQSKETWWTPQVQDSKHSGTNPTANGERDLLVNQVNWATPCSRDHHPNGQADGSKTDLGNQVTAQWGTPTARDHKSGRGNEEREYKELTPMVERQQSGKLNPRWVETLMGLPIGWTMPSCIRPVTTAPTSCDSSGMALCRPAQSERSDFLLASWPSPRAGESQQTDELSRLWVECGYKQPKTRRGKPRANNSTYDVTLETAVRGVAKAETNP